MTIRARLRARIKARAKRRARVKAHIKAVVRALTAKKSKSMPARPAFPRVLPFVVTPKPRWRLIDYRSLDSASQFKTQMFWTDTTKQFVESQGNDAEAILCTFDTLPKHKRMVAHYESLLLTRPDLTTAQYQEEFPETFRRYRRRADRDGFILGIRSIAEDEIIGGLYVSNIEVESNVDGVITATALMWPGINERPRMTRLESWMHVIRYVLNNPMPLANGTSLDLVGFDYTWDTDLTAISTRPGDEAFILAMAEEFDMTFDAPTGDFKLRRRPGGA